MLSLRTPAPSPRVSPSNSRYFSRWSRRRAWIGLATILALIIAGQSVPAAFASSVSAATFSGGTGTVTVGGATQAGLGLSAALTIAIGLIPPVTVAVIGVAEQAARALL